MKSRFSREAGYVTECGAAWLRTQARGVAVRIEVRGRIDASNSAAVGEHLRRFLKLDDPLIVDCVAAELHDDALRMLTDFDAACRTHQVEWLLAADLADRFNVGQSTARIPLAASLPDALELFTQAIRARRQLAAAVRQRPPILPVDDPASSRTVALEMQPGLDQC